MGRGIVIKIEGDGASAQRALDMVRQHLRETADEAKRDGGEMAEFGERVKQALEFAGVYAGLRELKEGIQELVLGSLELGETMEQAAKKTGLSVETMSVLHYAAGVLGTDFDQLVTGVGKMDKAVGQAADGNKKAGALMKSLGLAAKDLAGRTDGAEIAFHKFVDTLAATENPIRRAQLAQELLGKAGAAQIPVLIEVAQHWDIFKQKAQDAGVLLNGETAAALADTKQRLEDLKQSITGAGLALTEGLSPDLNEMFSVIRGGKSQMEQMKEWGHDIGKTLAFAGEVVYSLAAAWEVLWSSLEGGPKATEQGKKDYEAYQELMLKAQGMHDIAFGNAKPDQKPFLPESDAPGGKGFGGDGDGEGKGKSDNGIATAAVALIEEQAKAKAHARKAIDAAELADLDAKHKMLMIGDQEFFQERQRIQNDELDAEREGLETKEAALNALLKKQQGDKKLKRDKDGNSAEELKTQKELVQVGEQLADLKERSAALDSAAVADASVANFAAQLAGAKAQAQLEKERNEGLEKQIALIKQEHELAAQKILSQGGDVADAEAERTFGDVEAKKLRIEDINRRIAESEEENKLKVQAINDAVAKDPRLKQQGAIAIAELNRQEGASVQNLVLQYEALAQVLGGEYLTKAKALQAEIDKLERPDHKEASEFAKSLGAGFTSIAEKMATSTERGKKSFHDMVKSIEGDLLELAIKLAAQKWLTPALSGGGGAAGAGTSFSSFLFGSMGEHHMSGTNGGSSDGPQVLGEAGPEIWTPPVRGGSVIPNSIATKLAESGGGGGRAPNVTTNIVNQSSQPVTAQPSEVSYSAQLREFVIHTVLTDHAQGGPMSALGGGG